MCVRADYCLQIKLEDCFWTLEDRKMIIVHLEKVSCSVCMLILMVFQSQTMQKRQKRGFFPLMPPGSL